MHNLNYPVAFGAGVVSFFAPCVVPLLPAYIGYVTGVSLKDLQEKGYAPFRKKMFSASLFYILGFSLVFVLLGTAAASIGASLRRYDFLIQRVGGLIIVILGLNFAGFLELPFLARERKISLPSWVEKLTHARAFFVGIVFAMAWTPCVGAVLGSILSLAAATSTAPEGASLLFIYSLGISIPFMVVSMTLASAPLYLRFVTNKVGVISKVAGLILALLGALLLTNTYRFVNSWLFDIAFRLGYQIR